MCSFYKMDKIINTTPFPFPFVIFLSGFFIEFFIDSVATLNRLGYSIGSLCNYLVSLLYVDGGKKNYLNPMNLENTKLMEEYFLITSKVVEEDFGEDMALMQTLWSLTLLGELNLGSGDKYSVNYE